MVNPFEHYFREHHNAIHLAMLRLMEQARDRGSEVEAQRYQREIDALLETRQSLP